MVQAVAILRKEEVVAEPPAPLRERVLSGEYFGAHQTVAERVAGFAFLAPAEALADWFGTAAALRLSADPEACRGALDRDIATLDVLIGAQLDALLHHQRMRRFEGSWRGLAWLLGGLNPAGRAKVKVLNISWPELCRDLERAVEFDQSQLFRKIYEEEFGMPGGEPYGLLVIDHEVRHRPGAESRTDDVGAIAALSGVAAAAFSPIMIGASPGLLEVDRFADLATS